MDLGERLDAAIAARNSELQDLSRAIHDRPETRFREVHAAALLTQFLSEQHFRVQSVPGLDTAFVAQHGAAHPVVAFLAEYDALPDIGHACGHNLIAAMAVGAALSLVDVGADGDGGSVWVIGCPAEEGGGGKIRLIEAGIFTEVDVALMLHPADSNEVDPPYLARVGYDITFHGRASHVIAAPERGISALEAVLGFFHLVNSVRPYLRSDAHINAIITHGGSAPNVVPEFAALQVVIRTNDRTYLAEVESRVLEIARSAASAVGCEVQWTQTAPPYWDVRQNPVLAELARKEFDRVGRVVTQAQRARASTDLGNVSYVVPAFHGNIQLGPGLDPHTREFAAAAASPYGEQAVRDGARVLAGVGARLFNDRSLMKRVHEQFAAPASKDMNAVSNRGEGRA
ncbi:MAG: amidohydrolase [Sulfobacillus acidophilus]|uniref:Peptidase M20 domain-containing protein 2 n=1 Tax=Sulfobacillus acidophilus TaxID=53633 RepID=A0A2T2WGT5_9FIRM|nr:MAG: amidohydrolase [Sulfobacillus acidophilus]